MKDRTEKRQYGSVRVGYTLFEPRPVPSPGSRQEAQSGRGGGLEPARVHRGVGGAGVARQPMIGTVFQPCHAWGPGNGPCGLLAGAAKGQQFRRCRPCWGRVE